MSYFDGGTTNRMSLEESFAQWMISKGKAKQELVDIFVNENGNFKIEKRMAEVIKTTPNDWEEFYKENGMEYKGQDYWVFNK